MIIRSSQGLNIFYDPEILDSIELDLLLKYDIIYQAWTNQTPLPN